MNPPPAGWMTQESAEPGAWLRAIRRIASVHEAGHALIALDVGFVVQSIEVSAHVEATGGRIGACHYVVGSDAAPSERALAHLGGRAAERVVFGAVLGKADQDLRRAVAFVGSGAAEAIEAECAQWLAERRAGLDAVADELQRRDRLTGAEVIAIVQRVRA